MIFQDLLVKHDRDLHNQDSHGGNWEKHLSSSRLKMAATDSVNDDDQRVDELQASIAS